MEKRSSFEGPSEGSYHSSQEEEKSVHSNDIFQPNFIFNASDKEEEVDEDA